MHQDLSKTTVIKASGEQSAFSADKLRHSLLRSGASEDIVEDIVEKIITERYDGMPTARIYSKAFKLLKQYKRSAAARYKLKTAIMELGPTGFPFEQFIARIFEALGHVTQTGQILNGKCVTHEVDVVAKKDAEENLIECKFHHRKGICCDVKIPLYISARFQDIQLHRNSTNHSSRPFKGWLVTNTHFTKDAITYGLCAGLHLMGWDFPAKNSLRQLIDQYGMHPLTCLTTLTQHEKQQLLEQGLVLCSELEQHWDQIGRIVHLARLPGVQEECRHLSGYPKSQQPLFH